MTPRIMKHNPAFLTREELVASFVARQEDLAFVLEHIAENTGASSQHLLIVAPRGMGKTTLVLRAAEAVRTEERFSKTWFPLVYAEETYEVMSAGELWLEGLRHLGEQTKNEEILASYRELQHERDEQRLYDRALGQLLEYAGQRDKRILLLIENLHMLLGEQISKADAWRLRKTLQTERRLMLLATATATFEAIENSDQAFFDQFRMLRLEPLDIEGACRVWAHVARVSVPAEHMRPLHILTGGNPRLLAILASFAGDMSLRALMGDLVHLVDDHTTYFKSNLDSLPAKERKVYVTLAELWQPSTAREVAEKARVSPSEASALLNRLTQRGAVIANGEERKKVYQLAERMYNIYHLLRRSGGDETRVRAVVDFMVGFYDPISLGRVVRAIAEEGASLSENERRDHSLVMESLFRREPNLRVRELWWKEAKTHLETWSNAPKSLLEGLVRTSNARVEASFRARGLPFAECEKLMSDGLASIGAHKSDRFDDLDSYMKALTSGDEAAAAAGGLLGMVVGDPAESLPAIQRGLQADLSKARRALLLTCTAQCLMDIDEAANAEKALRDAIALSPKGAYIVANLSFLLAKTAGKTTEALKLAQHAINLDSSAEYAWRAIYLVFASMPTADLKALADTYGPMLQASGTSLSNHAIAGLWSLHLGTKTRQLSHLNAGLRAIWTAWEKGNKSHLLGRVVLSFEVLLDRTEHIEDLLQQLSTSLNENEIRMTFGPLWRSNNPAMHLFAVPYLTILLTDNTLGDARFPLIGLLVSLGRWDEARGHIQQLVSDISTSDAPPNPGQDAVQSWTRLFIDAAATNRAREALDLLTPSPLATWLEPVIVALQAFLGQTHRAPLEVTEISRDIVERIRQRAAAFQVDANKKATSHTPAKTNIAKRPRTRARQDGKQRMSISSRSRGIKNRAR